MMTKLKIMFDNNIFRVFFFPYIASYYLWYVILNSGFCFNSLEFTVKNIYIAK